MRSFRLDDDLNERLENVAKDTGQPASEIIRQAIVTRCDEHHDRGFAAHITAVAREISKELARKPASKKASARTGGFTAKDSGKAFAAHLAKKHGNRS